MRVGDSDVSDSNGSRIGYSSSKTTKDESSTRTKVKRNRVGHCDRTERSHGDNGGGQQVVECDLRNRCAAQKYNFTIASKRNKRECGEGAGIGLSAASEGATTKPIRS